MPAPGVVDLSRRGEYVFSKASITRVSGVAPRAGASATASGIGSLLNAPIALPILGPMETALPTVAALSRNCRRENLRLRMESTALSNTDLEVEVSGGLMSVSCWVGSFLGITAGSCALGASLRFRRPRRPRRAPVFHKTIISHRRSKKHGRGGFVISGSLLLAALTGLL